jgi:hypothetical protein
MIQKIETPRERDAMLRKAAIERALRAMQKQQHRCSWVIECQLAAISDRNIHQSVAHVWKVRRRIPTARDGRILHVWVEPASAFA